MTTPFPLLAALAALCLAAAPVAAQPLPSDDEVDARVAAAMEATGARGLALAVIDDGQVVRVATYGDRNAAGDPLEPQTVMYAASLTKAVFAYTVMQLVDEGRLDLDQPIAEILPRPLPDYTDPSVEDRYARWSDLAGDDRWRTITPRMLLNHASGFANFGFLEPDGVLRFHFQPGSRYAYSGDGIILMQFVLEAGMGLEIGEEMRRRVFAPLGMTTTSMMWRPDFAANLADGWTLEGEAVPHDERSAPRAAGSMDTTITDFARFAAAFSRGDGLSEAARREMLTGTLPITVATQFPTLAEELPPSERRPDLRASIGLVTFDGPQGPAWSRGGHNEITGNNWTCVERTRRCVVILSNDVRAEPAFPALTTFILGETGAPWRFLLGDMDFWNYP